MQIYDNQNFRFSVLLTQYFSHFVLLTQYFNISVLLTQYFSHFVVINGHFFILSSLLDDIYVFSIKVNNKVDGEVDKEKVKDINRKKVKYSM